MTSEVSGHAKGVVKVLENHPYTYMYVDVDVDVHANVNVDVDVTVHYLVPPNKWY